MKDSVKKAKAVLLKNITDRLLTPYGEDAFVIPDDVLDQLKSVVDYLLSKEGWKDKFSFETLENRIRGLVIEIRKKTLSSESAMDSLVSGYEQYQTKWTVYLPLFGVSILVPPFEIGNVTIMQMTLKELDKMRAIMQNVRGQMHPDIYLRIEGETFEPLRDQGCSKFVVVAEPKRAKERAEEETRYAIDVLRYISPPSNWSRPRCSIGLVGETVIPFLTRTVMVSEDLTELNPIFNRLSAGLKLEVNDAVIKQLQELTPLIDILRKPSKSRNEMESRLLSAIHWFATARNQIEQANIFLNFMIAIESLLTPPGGLPVSATIADSMAYIIGTDPAEKKKIRKDLLSLYDKRSRMAHEGATRLEDSDVAMLERMGFELIQRIARDFVTRMSEFKELQEWFNNEKFN